MQAFLRGGDNAVFLPKTLKHFSENFPVPTKPTCLTDSQRTIKLYSGNALQIGRPLDSVMIYLAGKTGAGKSSTINALFEDESLCQTSSTQSETKNVYMVEKTIRANKENPPVVGRIILVDTPGLLDTHNDDAQNLALIKQFKNECDELSDRSEVTLIGQMVIRASVFPNIVLFVVSAEDSRLCGSSSSFAKSLKLFQASIDVIDYERNNVIVALTHTAAMTLLKDKFEEKLREKTALIQAQFKEFLKLDNVLVVPVENCPEDYKLTKTNDFYELPDKSISHLNLFKAMISQAKANKDTLGGLLLSHYFDKCEEKHDNALVRPFVPKPNKTFFKKAAQEIDNLNMFDIPMEKGPTNPVYDFGYLGHGFCPAVERAKSAIPFENYGPLQEINIKGNVFSIPNDIKGKIEGKSKCQRLTFLKREGYQTYKKGKYNIDALMELVIQGNSEGKWLDTKESTNEHSTMLYLQEIQQAKFCLRNPDKILRNDLFERDLKNLPTTYDLDVHQAFFSKWGTHFIYEVAVGGYIQLKCTVKTSSINQTNLQGIDAGVKAIFSAIFSGNIDQNYLDKLTKLREDGVCNEILNICGGYPPDLPTLEHPNPTEIAKWSESISACPAELPNSIQISPYYDMLPPGDQRSALKMATEKFLKGEIISGTTMRSVNADIAHLEVTSASFFQRYGVVTLTRIVVQVTFISIGAIAGQVVAGPLVGGVVGGAFGAATANWLLH